MLKFWNPLRCLFGFKKEMYVRSDITNTNQLWTMAIQRDSLLARMLCKQPIKHFADAASQLSPIVDSTTVVRKPVRRRRPLTSVYDSTFPRGPEIVGVAMAESFRLLNLLDDEHLFSLYNCTHIDEVESVAFSISNPDLCSACVEIDDGLHFVPKPQYIIDQNAIKEFFCLLMRSQITNILSQYAELPYEAAVILDETDTLSFRMVKEGETRMKGDQLLLNCTNYLDGHFSSLATLERFAFSHGMAASVKVAIWEAQLLEYAEPLAKASKGLSVGRIPLKRKNVLMQTGTLLSLRWGINSQNDSSPSNVVLNKDLLQKINSIRFSIIAASMLTAAAIPKTLITVDNSLYKIHNNNQNIFYFSPYIADIIGGEDLVEEIKKGLLKPLNLVKHSINLNTNLIDSDFYWEKQDLEPYYRMALKHFAVSGRRRMLNAQLDYCSEILKVVNDMQTHNREARLEWMIIYLIVIEVFFAVIDHFGFGFGPAQKVHIDNCDELVNGVNEAMQKRQ
ncbi:N-adenine-specific dna methyltransferase 2-like protein [Dirofilaria immitis]|nr:N-adenine-specific dna methyltransferase 2-like protein [Dirofilaria immitis]